MQSREGDDCNRIWALSLVISGAHIHQRSRGWSCCSWTFSRISVSRTCIPPCWDGKRGNAEGQMQAWWRKSEYGWWRKGMGQEHSAVSSSSRLIHYRTNDHSGLYNEQLPALSKHDREIIASYQIVSEENTIWMHNFWMHYWCIS